MKVNKLLVVVGLVTLYTHTQLLAQEPKWGIHNSIVDYFNLTSSPLPTTPNPDYTQNAVWDNSGNLVLYEADGIVYNKNGGVILDMNNEADSLYSYFVKTVQTGFTEFIFVPVPNECNTYFGITSYSSGGGITDVVWCKIDLTLNSGLGDAIILAPSGLKIAKESISCVRRSVESQVQFDFQMHIEVTSKLSNGNRYLFASTPTCVSVLDLTNSGISFIDGYETWNVFAPNLRSEMEVFKTDELYEVALSTYNSFPEVGKYVSIFNFDMSGSNPQISTYNVFIPGNENEYRFVKGLEYSSDGLTLYASILTTNHINTSIVPGHNVVYFNRTSIGSQFSYGGVIASGSSTQDFGFGMIEKGNDGQLWVVGNGRLGVLVDESDPNSGFMENGLVIINQITNAGLYSEFGTSATPSDMDVWFRKMYLLVDQIDGEDYSLWMSVPDLYPSIISVTCFPFTFPYPIPPNANINYAGGVIWNYPTLELQSYVSTPLSIQFFNEYGCEHKENITVFYEEELWCDAEFQHTYTKAHSPNVPVSANCDYPGSTLHEYYLYQSDGQGGWILIDSCFTASCVLTGLQINQNYKIVHDVYNSGSSCHPFDTSYHLLSTF